LWVSHSDVSEQVIPIIC